MSTTTHQGAEGAESYQERVRQHFLYVAGDDTTDMPERRDRACEEFAELQQALGGTLEGWIAVGRYVWGRPVGEPAQEMGGTLNTLAALAAWADLDMMACGEAELERTKRPEIVAKIRRKRANRHGRGPLPGDDADLITATPAPRTDGGMSAGEVRDLRTMLRSALNRIAELEASTTPAQPAGAVPDSLRALSEALASAMAEQKRAGDFYNAAARRAERTFEDLTEVYEAFECAGSKLRQAKDALADHCLALLAIHPAGQSAGSGAEWRGPHVGPVPAAEPIPNAPATPPTILPLVAPDSTRTGQGEAEETVKDAASAREALRKAVSKALHDNQFLDDWTEVVDPVVDAVLAARPAVPEAQGAEPPWKPIAEAKHDGTVYLLGFYDGPEKTDEHWCAVEGWYETGINDRCWYDVFNERVEPAYFRERIAPPASSGQEG